MYDSNILGSWTGGTLVDDTYTLDAQQTMTQHVELALASTAPKHFRFFANYLLPLENTVITRAYATILLSYVSGEADTFIVPFLKTTGVLETVYSYCALRTDDILSSVDVTISTSVTLSVKDTVALQASLSEVEQHNNNVNPHNLPAVVTIGATGIKCTKGADVTFWLKNTGDVVLVGDITMQGGSILWDTIEPPAYSQITGSKPPSDADNTLEKVVAKGMTYTDGKLYIGADYITAGTIDASKISVTNIDAANITVGTIEAKKLVANSEANHYATFGTGTALDFTLYKDAVKMFQVYDTLTGIALKSHNHEFLAYVDVDEKLYPQGAWDFTNATVTNLTAVAVFG